MSARRWTGRRGDLWGESIGSGIWRRPSPLRLSSLKQADKQPVPQPLTSPRLYVTLSRVTISPQAQAIYHKLLPLVEALRKGQKVPQTVADFDARYAQTLARAEASTEPALKALGVIDTYLHMGGVGVLETSAAELSG